MEVINHIFNQHQSQDIKELKLIKDMPDQQKEDKLMLPMCSTK
jgi:hypothetical protein